MVRTEESSLQASWCLLSRAYARLLPSSARPGVAVSCPARHTDSLAHTDHGARSPWVGPRAGSISFPAWRLSLSVLWGSSGRTQEG